MNKKAYEPTADNRAALQRAIDIFGSQAELACEIECSKGSVTDWKTGRNWMSYETAAKIEKATKRKVTIKQLISREWMR